MKMIVQALWSPDLNPPSKGLPADTNDFDVLLEISIGELDREGSEVFGCRVCSASKLATAESGEFICHTLVLSKYDWKLVASRIEKLLLHTSSCDNWSSAIKTLSPYLRHSDG